MAESEYEIRRFEHGDTEEFLSLYATVMGERKGRDWFGWKYAANPHVDHVPIIVGTLDETIVAARPFFALPMRIRGEREIALQPADTMVHPDHRRRGLFTRMTERAIERYTGKHPLFFNFPNDRSRPGYLKLGWETVAERSTYYRIQRLDAVGTALSDRSAVRLACAAGAPVTRGYNRLRDRTAPDPDGITVRTEPNPAASLAALSETASSDRIHAARDEEFYRWRLGNPDWEYTAYVADGDAGPEAAVVAGTTVDREPTTTKLTDVVPLGTAPEDALAGLIGRVVADHTETDLFAAPPQGIPVSVLQAFGFHADTSLPLSYLTSQTTHVVRTLPDDRVQNETDVTDPDSWLLTFAEADTS